VAERVHLLWQRGCTFRGREGAPFVAERVHLLWQRGCTFCGREGAPFVAKRVHLSWQRGCTVCGRELEGGEKEERNRGKGGQGEGRECSLKVHRCRPGLTTNVQKMQQMHTTQQWGFEDTEQASSILSVEILQCTSNRLRGSSLLPYNNGRGTGAAAAATAAVRSAQELPSR